MGVSPQQITKIVSGKENLTIETQIKLQNILDIPVLASYYKNKEKEKVEWIFNVKKQFVNVEKPCVMILANDQNIDILEIESYCSNIKKIQAYA